MQGDKLIHRSYFDPHLTCIKYPQIFEVLFKIQDSECGNHSGAISSSGHPKRRHGYQKNQHIVLYQPHISTAANRHLDHRKKQEIGRFLPKISIARLGDSDHQLLRSRYGFSNSRAVLAASCVSYEKFLSFGWNHCGGGTVRGARRQLQPVASRRSRPQCTVSGRCRTRTGFGSDSKVEFRSGRFTGVQKDETQLGRPLRD
ncbi:hypothetical protein L3X38_033196 [Prunus dulcis]|uniref:Uncharacterized protein n=1 Tax=Prunus dulcis TaxID=3755 RepID=A0AAD4VFQ5_PRUDU|nr:hypothetical protein L3X38_033196 [Prunus dulcis]